MIADDRIARWRQIAEDSKLDGPATATLHDELLAACDYLEKEVLEDLYETASLLALLLEKADADADELNNFFFSVLLQAPRMAFNFRSLRYLLSVSRMADASAAR